MVSEKLCLAILRLMHGHTMVYTETLNLDDEGNPVQKQTPVENSIDDSRLYRGFLADYSLADIDTAVRWLELSGYLGYTQFGLGGIRLRTLTEHGVRVAQSGGFDEKERKLFYPGEDPYAVFIAQQFNKDDQDLVTYIRERLLNPNGFSVLDGRVDGLEDFRSAILTKIQRARFFLCLLTKRQVLASGNFVSSVWLYQETGAAVAYGKKPLLLVEDGIESDYIGELQKTYEYEVFTRSNFPSVFDSILRRFSADLDANGVPRPKGDASA